MPQINLRVTDEMLVAIEAARGDVSRNRWLERAVEAALSWTVATERALPLDERYREDSLLAATGITPHDMSRFVSSSAAAKRGVMPIGRPTARAAGETKRKARRS